MVAVDPERSLIRTALDQLHGEFNADGHIRVIYLGFLGSGLLRSVELNLLHSYARYFKPPIVEIGCGNGLFSSLLLDEMDVGVDLDFHALLRAKAKGVHHHLVQADASAHLPLPDASVRTVISNSVLEHIPDVLAVVAETARVLMPGGVFVFTTYTNHLTHYLAKWFGWEDAKTLNRHWQHVSLLSERDWLALLEANSLNVMELERYLPEMTVRRASIDDQFDSARC